MTGQAVEIPWAPGANYTRIICRLGEPRPDGTDADENPDLMTQGGTVTLACTAKKIRYAEEDGRSRMLTTKAWTFKVRLSDGELYNPESGNVGVKILSGSSAGVDPAGFTWTATVTPDSGESWFCTIPPTAGDTFDLVSNADVVAPSPGESTLTQRVKALEDAGPGTGAYPVQQVALTGNLAYTLPQDAPSDQVISVVFKQPATPPTGYTVTYGGTTLSIDSTPGSSTTVEFWPVGSSWRVVYPEAAASGGTTVPDATTSVKGIVELATTTEATTGTDTSRAVTPAGTRAHGDARYVRTINGTGPDSTGDVAVSGGGTLPAGVAESRYVGVDTKTASYTITAGDEGKLLNVTSPSPVTITLPTSYATGANIAILQGGDGSVTVATGSTLIGSGTPVTRTKGSQLMVTKLAVGWAYAGDVVQA